MTTTVYLGPGGRRSVGNHTVYLRRLWSDEWVSYSEAHCTECVWACAPSMPAATVVWKYGLVKQLASTVFTHEAKLDVSRWYIKIVWQTDVSKTDTSITTREWYGVISDVEDETAGHVFADNTKYPTGQQVLHCFGMQYLLDQNCIASSIAFGGGSDVFVAPLPITFNNLGHGNRTEAEYGVIGQRSYVFDGTPEDPTHPYRQKFSDWSTRNIVEYILTRLSPTRSVLWHDQSIPFVLTMGSVLADTDAPVLPQEGRTPLSLLNSLMDRRRLMSFYCFVDTPSGGSETVYLMPFSFSGEDIDSGQPGLFGIKANNTQVYIEYDEDEMTAAAVRRLDVNHFDRVLVRGARRTTTATFNQFTDEFEQAWTVTDELAYEAGASEEDGYSGWDKLKKVRRNAEVRSQEALRSVYSWFRIPDDWNGKVHDTIHPTLTFDCFVGDDGFSTVKQYIHEVTIDNQLRMWEGVDYSADTLTIALGDPRDYVYRKPLVIFQRVDGTNMNGDAVAETAEGECDPTEEGTNTRWSAQVRVPPHSRIFEVRVSGEPQHVIAYSDFSPLADDRNLGKYDWRNGNMICTMSLQECRYAEGSYPEPDFVDSTLIDAQRTMIIWLGDEFRKDYVVPGTVVDVDDDATLKITNQGGYVTDDTPQLKAIARIAYEWYKVDRSALMLTTNRLVAKTELDVGFFVLDVGDADIASNTHNQSIDAPITEIRIRNPMMALGSTSEPSMSIVTGDAQLDPLTVVPAPRRERRVRRGR